MKHYFVKVKEEQLNKITDLLVELEPHFEIELEEVEHRLKITFTEPEMKPCEWSNLLTFHKCKEPELLDIFDQLASFTHDVKVINETSGVECSWFELQLMEFIEHCQVGDAFSPMKFEFIVDLFEITKRSASQLHRRPTPV